VCVRCARLSDLAAEYGVNGKTIRRRLADAERAWRSAARHRREADESACSAPTTATRSERPSTGPRVAASAGSAAIRPRASSRLGLGGVPLFPNTLEGQYERLAYYEARKLDHLPHSLLDYHDVIHGRETPAERRVREGSGRRR
jgi:hypothetical protein